MIARALTAAVFALMAGSAAGAGSANRWVCADQDGVATEQDHACEAGKQVVSEPKPVGLAPLVEPEPEAAAAADAGSVAEDDPLAARVADKPVSEDALKVVAGGGVVVVLVILGAFVVGRREKIAQGPIPSARRVFASPAPPTQWSIEVLRGLEPRRFTRLVQRFWSLKGYPARLAGTGEEGVDVIIADRATPLKVFAVARCELGRVDAAAVRALWEAHERFHAPLAIFYSTSGFDDEAQQFVAGKHLKLVTGDELLRQVGIQPEAVKIELLVAATA